MRDFIYHAPTSLEEALSLLDQYGEDARPIAGGTAMVNLLKQNLVYADHLVGLSKVPGLRGITRSNGDLRIGALTKHREVERSAEVSEAAPLLQEAYSRVATVRIRNMATVGGGLTHADPAQDPPPALMALGARGCTGVLRRDAGACRSRTSSSTTTRRRWHRARLLTEVIVPAQPQDARGVYLKFLPRTEDDYATVAVAALARVENGVCADVRVALGAVAPTPVRATAVEAALEGQPVTADAIRSAAEAVAGPGGPARRLSRFLRVQARHGRGVHAAGAGAGAGARGVKFTYDVIVEAPQDRVWAILSDVPQAASLLPGVEAVEQQPDGSYTGTVRVRVGPIGINLAGRMEVDQDRAAGTWRLKAQADDRRIGGGVASTVETVVSEPAPGRTQMSVSADVQFSGRLGQLGQPLIKKKADDMVQEFAEGLKRAVAG